MTDFLGRLAQRTLWPHAEVTPDIAPVFSSVRDPEHGEGASTSHLGQEMPEVDQRPSEPSSALNPHDGSATPIEGAVRPAPSVTRPVVDSTLVERVAPAEQRPIPAGAPDSRAASTPDFIAPVPDAMLEPRPNQSSRAPWQNETARIQPSARHEAGSRFDAEPRVASHERPTIKISIGRIDVRAMTSPVAPPPQRSPESRNQLRSLDSYLDERNGRRR